MSAVNITNETFEAEVMQQDKPVLVDFWAAWCGPCRALLPTVEALAQELTDVKVCKINVDEQPALAARFRVMIIPTLLLFRNGKPVKTLVGVQSREEILHMLRS